MKSGCACDLIGYVHVCFDIICYYDRLTKISRHYEINFHFKMNCKINDDTRFHNHVHKYKEKLDKNIKNRVYLYPMTKL